MAACLFDESCQLAWCEILISAAHKVRDSFPIHFVQIQTKRNPAFWPKIRRHKETNRIFFNEAALVAQARLAAERDLSVPVVVKEIVGKNSLANAKGKVLFAGDIYLALRKRFAEFYESLKSLRRC